MKTLVIAAATMALGSVVALPAAAQDEDDLEEIREVIAVMTERDPGMQEWFNTSHAYAVFPNVGKAGFGIGGARGNGIAYVGGTPVGKTKLSAVTIGLQVGGQSFVEVIFFKDQTAWADFTRENFEFGAQVSAVALSAGVSADMAYNGGVAVVTMAKGGLMYEATVSGQKFEYEAYGN
jgi:lipid-binding SYLF domain-containing protein